MCREKIGVSLVYIENRAIMSNIELPALSYFIRQFRSGGAAVLHFADVGKMLCVRFFWFDYINF